jgi:L-cysteine:1D-myo-inositol 2-amino-2-deoxy-alpha-D-glucopyranoside ligase
MSKSLGNLVFVDALRRDWDPRAIRLAVHVHHYRTEWEWTDHLMPEATSRLDSWAASVSGPEDFALLDAVRERLDDDLDTPGVVTLVDEAARGGHNVHAAASLLGISLH